MPFVAVANALAAFVATHNVAAFWLVNIIGYFIAVQVAHSGYLTLAGTFFQKAISSPPVSNVAEPANITSEIVNINCRIITDLTIFQPTPPSPVPFWNAILDRYSIQNIQIVVQDMLNIYGLLWSTIPRTWAPFVVLLINLLVTWHVWLCFCWIVGIFHRKLLTRYNRRTAKIRSSTGSSGLTSLSQTTERSPYRDIVPGDGHLGTSRGVWQATAAFWRLFSRVYYRCFQNSDRDSQNHIKQLQEDLAKSRSKELAASVQTDTIRRLQLTLASLTETLNSSQKSLDDARSDLKDSSAESDRLKETTTQLEAKVKEQEQKLRGQATYLQSLKSQALQIPSRQKSAASPIKSVASAPVAAPESPASIPQATQTDASETTASSMTQTEQTSFDDNKTITAATIQSSIPRNVDTTSRFVTSGSTDVSAEKAKSSVSKAGPSAASKGSLHGDITHTSIRTNRSGIMAQNTIVAVERYHMAFPHGFLVLSTSSKDWHCGLDAIIKTMSAMHPGRTQPTMNELKLIFANSEHSEKMEEIGSEVGSVTDWFTPDMLDVILRKWASTHSQHYYRVGYIQQTRNGVEPALCVGLDDDMYSEDIVWVYLRYEKIGPFETGHYEGVVPALETVRPTKAVKAASQHLISREDATEEDHLTQGPSLSSPTVNNDKNVPVSWEPSNDARSVKESTKNEKQAEIAHGEPIVDQATRNAPAANTAGQKKNVASTKQGTSPPQPLVQPASPTPRRASTSLEVSPTGTVSSNTPSSPGQYDSTLMVAPLALRGSKEQSAAVPSPLSVFTFHAGTSTGNTDGNYPDSSVGQQEASAAVANAFDSIAGDNLEGSKRAFSPTGKGVPAHANLQHFKWPAFTSDAQSKNTGINQDRPVSQVADSTDGLSIPAVQNPPVTSDSPSPRSAPFSTLPHYVDRGVDIPDPNFRSQSGESTRVDQWNRIARVRWAKAHPHVGVRDVPTFVKFELRYPELYQEQQRAAKAASTSNNRQPLKTRAQQDSRKGS